ncbi:MAG: HAMP domain-containing protein [Planctomycetes bacterium]|nr:HAMP domain-containing protein [Planctomycetota bacterium]
MSLRSKIVLILVTVVVGYAAIENVTTRLAAGRIFGGWERQEADEDLARIKKRLDDELTDLVGKAAFLAGTGELSRFVDSGDARFAQQDLGRAALLRGELDLFYVCAASGKVVWGEILDPETREPMRLADFPRESLAPNHPALLFRAEAENVAGIYMTRAQPLLLGAVPIPGADGVPFAPAEGNLRHAAHGVLVFGRFLGPSLKRRIVEEELQLTAGDEVAAPRAIELLEREAAGVPAEMKSSAVGTLYREGDDGFLHAYARLSSLRTDLPLVLHVALDRAIAAKKRASVNYLLLSTLIGGCLILLVLLRLLQRIVVAPLSTLTQKAVEIGRRDDTTIRVGLQRDDEIGQLAGEFDRMLGKLAKSREQVIETARLAGMSEIATGVLHNVGNVLNSVNVAANLATRRTEELAVGDLELLVGVLQTHERDLAAFVGGDPRGKHLVPYLKELSGALGTQRRSIQDELKSLNQGIEHIAELVCAQQSFAGAKGVFEQADLAAQLEAALAICRQGLAACPELEITRDFETLPTVRVDKHKLMEVLVNLVQNAGQALAERGGTAKLTLRLTRHGAHLARIEVRDNGVGIPRENLTRIFHHGFTTKKNGHGFGLHVSANAATEMGAKLHAHSDGPGRGATFFLDIPMEAEAALSAA